MFSCAPVELVQSQIICLEHLVLLLLFCSHTIGGQSTQRRLLLGRHLDGKQDTAFSTLGSSVLRKISHPVIFTTHLGSKEEEQGEKKLIPMFTSLLPFQYSFISSQATSSLGMEWEGDRRCSLVFHLFSFSSIVYGVSFGFWYLNYFQLLCQWFSHFLVSGSLLSFKKLLRTPMAFVCKGYIYQYLLYQK